MRPGIDDAERNDGFYSKYRDATETGWGRWVLMIRPRSDIDGVGEEQ